MRVWHSVLFLIPILLLSFNSAKAQNSCFEVFSGHLGFSAEQQVQFQKLNQLGYDSSISRRFVLYKSYSFVDSIIGMQKRPITVFRGINTLLEKYDPKFSEGISSRAGKLWVTQKTETAAKFTEGILLKMQIPEYFGSQRVFDRDGITIERMILSRMNEVKDDREFLLEIFVPSENKWFSYDEAVQRGWLKELLPIR